MYTDKQKPYGLSYQTGDFVNTPIDEIGYIVAIRNYGVLVRCPGAGRVDKRCMTPRASHSSLWVFQPQDLTRYIQPEKAEPIEAEETCESLQA